MFWVGSRGERKSKAQHAVSANLGNQMVCLVRDFFSAELVVWWFVAMLTNSCFPAGEGGADRFQQSVGFASWCNQTPFAHCLCICARASCPCLLLRTGCLSGSGSFAVCQGNEHSFGGSVTAQKLHCHYPVCTGVMASYKAGKKLVLTFIK